MPIIERDVLFRGIDKDGNQTVDFPITRLGNVEGDATVKNSIEKGDYIAVMDSGANGEMKMIKFSDLIAALDSDYKSFLLENSQNYLQTRRAIADAETEVGTVTLRNTLAYPSNNSVQTIALKKPRNNLEYQVVVDQPSDPRVGAIKVYDKQTNGFKIAYEGEARQAVIKYYVSGGIK